ncbi:MAG: hypothetical protein AAFO69_10700 [Bacteroidota bacterium]
MKIQISQLFKQDQLTKEELRKIQGGAERRAAKRKCGLRRKRSGGFYDEEHM